MKIKHFKTTSNNRIIVLLFNKVYTNTRLLPYEVNRFKIYAAQQKELLYVFWYLIYAIEFIVKLVRKRNIVNAIASISFVKEATYNQRQYKYMDTRRNYSWASYL